MDQAPLFDLSPEKEASKLQFLRRQFSSGPPAVSRNEVNLAGKTAVVTGANGGIGMECSRQLLDLGLSKLILAVRDESKGEAARKILIAERELESGQTIEVWKLDYSNYKSITDFIERAEKLNPRLDIAILNAGVNRGSFIRVESTGHEDNLQTNYLSTILLALLLVDVFKKTSSDQSGAAPLPGRIVVVSSDMASWARFEEKEKTPIIAALDDTKAKFNKFDRYATVKLMGQLFVVALAKLVPQSLAVINCANPGLCQGVLGRELGVTTAVFTRVIGRSPVIGARTLVIAATKCDESSHGQYVEDGVLRP